MGDESAGFGKIGFEDILLVVACVCAVVVTGLLVHRELLTVSPQTVQAGTIERGRVADWQSLADSGHSIGSPAAKVEMVVFADYQCPACRRLATILRALRAEFTGDLRYVHRHFPLSTHPEGRAAAQAAECAAEQERFSTMHHVLYREQAVMGKVPWTYFAKLAGLPDSEEFETCMARDIPGSILRDRAVGEEIGVDATPTLIVEGERFDGAPPYQMLRGLIRQKLNRDAE